MPEAASGSALAEERCDLTDMLVDQCAHCRPKPPKPLGNGATIVAQFGSECSCGCGEHVAEGEQITYSTEADGWCKASHVRTLEAP